MAEDEEGDEVPLSEGMPIENAQGEKLGKLSALLVEEEDEEAEFLLLHNAGADRLVPFEAVLGVEDGTLLLDVPAANVARFPKLKSDAEPTQAEMQLAYDVFDEGATDWDEEGDEEEDDDEK